MNKKECARGSTRLPSKATGKNAGLSSRHSLRRDHHVVGRLLLAILALSAAGTTAFAQTVFSYTTTITTLGAQGQGAGGLFYVQPATNPQLCLNGVIYIQIGAVGSAQYATALAAFYSSRNVRIDYTQDSTNQCWVQIIGGY